MWKKLVSSSDLIVQETVSDGLNVRIEARNNPMGWNIIKRYYHPECDEHSYTEDYFKTNRDEVKEALVHLQNDLLTKTQIKKIKDLKRNFDISISRIYNEGNVEKWQFFIQSLKKPLRNALSEDGTIVVKYGQEIEIDIMTKGKFRHFEEEMMDLINEKLGFSQSEKDIIHNFYYYYDSSTYRTKQKKQMVPAMLIK